MKQMQMNETKKKIQYRNILAAQCFIIFPKAKSKCPIFMFAGEFSTRMQINRNRKILHKKWNATTNHLLLKINSFALVF